MSNDDALKPPERIWMLRSTRIPWPEGINVPIFTKRPPWHDDEPMLHEYVRAPVLDEELVDQLRALVRADDEDILDEPRTMDYVRAMNVARRLLTALEQSHD